MTEKRSGREKRQRARRLGILTDAQVAMGWFVILALAALLGAVYLSQASRIAGTGRQVQLMQNRLDELKRENAALERSIAEAQGLERLQQEAARLGFVRAAPGDMEYVPVAEYPAVSTEGPTPTPPPPEPAATMKEAIWLEIQRSVSGMVRGQSGQ
jgi:cell division protein FtsL